MRKNKITASNIFEIGNKILKHHPEFFRFLKEKSVYDKWMKNRHEYMLKFHDEFDVLCETDLRIPQEDFLISYYTSFSWDETPEGFSFWEDLNKKWYASLEMRRREFNNIF
jgi:hypothetical protein